MARTEKKSPYLLGEGPRPTRARLSANGHGSQEKSKLLQIRKSAPFSGHSLERVEKAVHQARGRGRRSARIPVFTPKAGCYENRTES